MLKLYVCIFLSATSSLIHGMLPFYAYSHRELSLEQKQEQEKKAYDELQTLVLSRITNKEDLNKPLEDEFAQAIRQTPLHKACMLGDNYIAITQLVLTHHANPNVLDLHKSTPLHYAVKVNALETVLILLSSGAYSDSRDSLVGTPLQGICARAQDMLNDENIAKKRVYILKALLSHGANPNARDEYQKTCLRAVIATPWQHLNYIDSLRNSNKALFFSQRKALIRALLLYGATLNARDSTDKDPVQKAYDSDDSENQPYYKELADCALNYSGYLRTRLLYILGHSGTHKKHETPFKALPKDIVKCIIDFTYPAYSGPQIIKAQKT